MTRTRPCTHRCEVRVSAATSATLAGTVAMTCENDSRRSNWDIRDDLGVFCVRQRTRAPLRCSLRTYFLHDPGQLAAAAGSIS